MKDRKVKLLSERSDTVVDTRIDEEAETKSELSVRELSCDPPSKLTPLTEVLSRIQATRKRPLFVLISGFIDSEVCRAVYSWKTEIRVPGIDGGLDVLIHSPGGELTSCYRIARLFSRCANGWQALVPALAASGATMISLGSSKVIMADVAFLGPMDPQVISRRQGKFFALERQSPLEAFQAVRYLREFALTSLDAGMQFLLEHGVAPRPALDTAANMAVALSRPILEKIDPFDLGAFSLDSILSMNYCERNSRPLDTSRHTQKNVDFASLVERYPAHEFTIDLEEAQALGFQAEGPDGDLDALFDELSLEFEDARDCIGLIAPDREDK